jgi:hypothetical protein
VNSPLPSFSFFPFPTFLEISTGLILIFTYMCTQYLYNIHHPIPFPHILSPSTQMHRTFFTLLFPNFLKEKWHFCSVKIAIQGVSLWHVHVYALYIKLVHLYFSSFYLTPFLMVSSTHLKIPYSSVLGRCSTS